MAQASLYNRTIDLSAKLILNHLPSLFLIFLKYAVTVIRLFCNKNSNIVLNIF